MPSKRIVLLGGGNVGRGGRGGRGFGRAPCLFR